MPIYQLDPDAAKRQQYNMVMQMLVNAAMQRTQLEARKKEAETARTWEEAREKRVATRQEELAAKELLLSGKAKEAEAEKNYVELGGKKLVRKPPTYTTINVGGHPAVMTSEGKIQFTPSAKKQAVKGEEYFYNYDPTTGDFEKTNIKIDKSGNKFQAKTKYTYDEKGDTVWAQDYNYDPKTSERTPAGDKYRAPKNLGFDLLKFMLGGQGGGLKTGKGSSWDGPGMYMMPDGSQKIVSTQEEYDSIFSGE